MTWIDPVFREMRGWLAIRVTAKDPAQFIRSCWRDNIALWDVVQEDGALCCSLYAKDIRKVLAARRKSGFRFRILKKSGLPFLVRRTRMRPGFVLGAFLFGLGLFLLPQFIWKVEVSGAQTADPDALMRTAGELGLRQGALKAKLDAESIAQALVSAHEEISWATVRVRGVRALVEVAERTMPPASLPEPLAHDIVAKKAGVVVSVVGLLGQPAVRRGQTVLPGDVLVSWTEDVPSAQGLVIARTWYENEGFCAFSRKTQRLTGARAKRASIVFRGKETVLFGPKNSPYEVCCMKETRLTVPWRNICSAVEFKLTAYEEAVDYEEELSFEQAKACALDCALFELLQSVPKDAERVSIQGEAVESDSGVSARVLVETLEDIGVAIPRQLP